MSSGRMALPNPKAPGLTQGMRSTPKQRGRRGRVSPTFVPSLPGSHGNYPLSRPGCTSQPLGELPSAVDPEVSRTHSIMGCSHSHPLPQSDLSREARASRAGVLTPGPRSGLVGVSPTPCISHKIPSESQRFDFASFQSILLSRYLGPGCQQTDHPVARKQHLRPGLKKPRTMKC